MKQRLLSIVLFFAVCWGIGLYAYRDGLRQQAVRALHRITEENILYHQAITYPDKDRLEQTELLHDPRQAEVAALFRQITEKDISLCDTGAYGHDHSLYLCLTDQTELLFDLHLEGNDTFHFGLAGTDWGYDVTLPGLTDLLWGMADAAPQTPSTDPMETVQSAVETRAEEDYTISIRFEGGTGLTLLLPDGWQGQCGVETDQRAGETYYRVYHKGIRDAFMAQLGNDSGGVLFSVMKVSDEPLTEAQVNADSGFSTSHNRYITAKEGGTYLLFYASDVQFTEDTMALYRRFESQIENIQFVVE